MKLTTRQDMALSAVSKWLNDSKDQVFRLFGYAGTGKTTLAKHFAEGVGGKVLYGAFTGKAAHVLQSKGCSGATTIHRLIYQASDKSKGRLMEMEEELRRIDVDIKKNGPTDEMIQRAEWLRTEIEKEKQDIKKPHFVLKYDSEVKDARLVIIDECSMVDEKMGMDLLSYGTKVLVLGDPEQLPPVKGAGFFTECKPDVMLEDIHRQAENNPIIEMATKVRRGENLELGVYGNSCVIDKGNPLFNPSSIMEHDQVIVGKNATRHAYNARFRDILKREGKLPTLGDKLVCLRNNHELGLLNGSIWSVTRVEEGQDQDSGRWAMEVTDEDGALKIEVVAHTANFLGEEIPYYEKRDAEEFDYGYALTCHKSQGSQWESVFVLDQSGVFGYNRKRWLYTAITRASERVTICKL